MKSIVVAKPGDKLSTLQIFKVFRSELHDRIAWKDTETSRDKIKTDAIKLARLLRSGELESIHGEEDEAVRDYLRSLRQPSFGFGKEPS